MRTVKTCELIGAALDWSVAQIDDMCDGLNWYLSDKYKTFVGAADVDGEENAVCAFLAAPLSVFKPRDRMLLRLDGATFYRPSKDWSQCGPLIEQEQIELKWDGVDGEAYIWLANHQDIVASQNGATPLIAACRAIVAAKLGDTVQIPEGLWVLTNDTALPRRPDSKDAGADN